MFNDPTTLKRTLMSNIELMKTWGCFKCRKLVESNGLPEGWEIVNSLIYCNECRNQKEYVKMQNKNIIKCDKCNRPMTEECVDPDSITYMCYACKHVKRVDLPTKGIDLPSDCPYCKNPLVEVECPIMDGRIAISCNVCRSILRWKEENNKINEDIKGVIDLGNICPQCHSIDTRYHHTEIDKALHVCNSCYTNFYIYPPDQKESTFTTGAKRSKDVDQYRYDLISPIGLARLAKIYKEGIDNYPAWNLNKGFPIYDLINHGLHHLNRYRSGDRSEDHLAKMAWAMFTAMQSEELWPHLNEKTLMKPGGNCEPPECEEFYWKDLKKK